MDNVDFKIIEGRENLSEVHQKLIDEAIEALSASYSPYSQFRVGAALMLSNGTIIRGNNQENASYPAGICAERSALFTCGAIHPNEIIESIAVVARRASDNILRSTGPCGICRQVMLEFENKQNKDIEVIFQSAYNQWVMAKNIKVLLPFSFNASNL